MSVKPSASKRWQSIFLGDPKRMVRFDMNEFVAGDAVERLVGTFARPQGLLTAAIRRQPYAVVLLDEIEKAHSTVFDLLLQVLGDGRLTDAVGETADFCNCIVILTSNLGARDAKQQLGFASESKDDSTVYTEAAQKFFRPELCNRLDHVIPFHPLERKHLHGMVENLVNRALRRQGITSRRLNLEVAPELPEALVRLGFKPEFGARALRRAIEEYLVEPLSVQIGELPLNEPALVKLTVDEENALSFSSSRFVEAKRADCTVQVPGADTADEIVDRCNGFIARMDKRLEGWLDAESSTSSDTSYSAGQMHYYRMREELVFLRRQRDALMTSAGFARSATHSRQRRTPSRFGKDTTRLVLPKSTAGTVLKSFYESPDPSVFFKEVAHDAEILPELVYRAEELIFRACRFELLAPVQIAEPDRVFVRLHESSHQQSQVGKPDDHTLEQGIWNLFHAFQLGLIQWFSSAPNMEGTYWVRDLSTGKLERLGVDAEIFKAISGTRNEPSSRNSLNINRYFSPP